MNGKEIQFYAQKKERGEMNSLANMQLETQKLLQYVKDVCLTDLLLIALFYVLPDSAC